MRPLRLAAASLLLLLGAPRAWAQDQGPTLPWPDTVVVTASRLPEDVRRTGQRVAVWTARDLSALPVSSFDELLRTAGGVETFSRGGFGVQSDITIRGAPFNGVLVLLDGVRLNDPMTGHFLSDFPVPLSEIARMEVLRGPATALYGPDALGGVIQLFTYTGLRTARTPPAHVEGSVTLQGGTHALHDADAALRHTAGRTTLGVSGAAQGSDGMPVRDAAGGAVVGSMGSVRTDFQRQAFSAAATHPLGGATLFARFGYDDRDFGAYRFYTPFPSDTAREATRTYWAQARLASPDAAATRWAAQVALRQHKDTYVYNPETPANVHTSQLLTAQVHAFHHVDPRLMVGGGASASLRAIDSNNLGRHHDGTAGAFASARWQPLPALTLSGSARLDHDPAFGLEATPQVRAAYNAGAFTLRAGAGRAVRAPNYVERFLNTTLARPRGRDLGNPGLTAERAWAYEAGVDAYPAQGVSLHATAFTRRTRDLIDYVKLAPDDTVFLARNVLNVRTTGIELDAEAHRAVGDYGLHLAASYTWLHAALGDTREVAVYKYALTNARHLLQGTATVEAGPVSVGLQGLWKAPPERKAYGVLNVQLSYQLPAGPLRVRLVGEVRNVFDHAYTEVFDAPMPRRWWLAGIRLLW